MAASGRGREPERQRKIAAPTDPPRARQSGAFRQRGGANESLSQQTWEKRIGLYSGRGKMLDCGLKELGRGSSHGAAEKV